MRSLLVVLALTVSVVVPRASSADDWPPARLAERVSEPVLVSQLPTLFRALGVELIPSAHAAERACGRVHERGGDVHIE